MKSPRFVKYISFLTLMALLLAGCQNNNAQNQPAENQNESTDSTGDNTALSEDNLSDVDAEEYFNSLLEGNSGDYQNKPDTSNGTEGEDTLSDSIVPDLNPDGVDLNQNAVGAIEIGELNKDNGYLEMVPVGETCTIDLNNDGQMDVITYNATTSNIEEYGTTVESFTINGGDYKYTLYLSNQGIHIQDPDLDWYYITDINTRDSYKEIAILDHGANGIPYTYFIRYVGSGTYCLGYVPYFPEDDCFRIKGDGSVESAYDLKLLPNWQAPATWLSGSDQLLSSNLAMRKPDLYYLYDEQYVDGLTQLKDLKIYPSRSLTSTAIDAKATDALVTFTQTDDEHWVYMKRDDEVEGWLYMEDKDTVVSGDTKYNIRDVFKD